MVILKYNDKRGKIMTKENLTKLISFKTLYLALLTFVVLHLVLLVLDYLYADFVE